MKKLIYCVTAGLLLASFFKALTWVEFIPLWHFPDEQAHFGHVAYLTEGGQPPMGRTNDLTKEIALSEQFLGTYRNKYGNNNFTYHPEYRIEYSYSHDGIHESEIKSIPLSDRKEFTDPESAYYPHFFYNVSGVIYKLFYYSDIFIRVFSLRLFWLSTHLLMVYFAYMIGKIIFPKSKLAAVSVAVLTGFQPMVSFVAAGVSSDNLHNLAFTVVIYLCLKLWSKFTWRDLAALAVVMYLGYINKPQFLVAWVIVIPVLFWRWKRWLPLVALIPAILYFQGRLPYFDGTGQARPDYNLWQHLVYTVNHTVREVLPWYWGVFRWLSLTLPRWVNQVMMRLLLVAGIGLAIKIWRCKFEPGFWIIVWSALVYFLALFFWDWQQVRNSGFPFGIQGRYYFPVVVPHMVLLIMGISAIWSKLLIILDYWFIVLNGIALYWVLNSYYDTSSFNSFIIQASQYKPFFAKGWWLIVVLVLYIVTSLFFSIQLFKLHKNEK